MKIVETTFERLPRERLEIGFEGENLRATVRIDCASVFAEYPNATPTLIVKPLFADAYPVVVDRNGTDVDWLITSEILSFTGDGEIQLTFVKDQVICKSAIAKIRVSRSLQVTGEMPDPVVQWIENANRKLAEVDAQIVELEGMVDTATDAATRAEQSASTASTKAEQAAGSAATATEKATEATQAAGTATAKAAEAQTAAQTATEKATAAAESERIATAKAVEATTAAGTATTKAEQATEAAQTATEKAADASASATAAHASATDAASSATAAQASQTAAKASETAASTSASQAAQSVLDAGTAAQTAMQKAAEATQSATNAAASATSAATSAETASTKAGEAAQSAQAVAETAEQLAESLEQIAQNTQDIAELDERKANIDGYYPDMTVGNAEQLNSSKYVENSEPYTFRTSGGTSDIGNREYVDAVVGGTLAWNQKVRDEASENQTDFAPIVTVTDAVEDAAGVKVKIEPVQDLHGYDHPWPAGGGKNLLPYPYNSQDGTVSGITFSTTWDGKITASGTSTAGGNFFLARDILLPAGTHTISITGTHAGVMLYVRDPNAGVSLASIASSESSASFTLSNAIDVRVYLNINSDNISVSVSAYIQLEEGSTATSYEPYSNICPITGWDGVQVQRTGKNLFDINHATLNPDATLTDGEIYMPSPSFQSIWLATRLIPFSGLSGAQYTFSASMKSESANNIGIAIHYTDGTITYGNRSDAASTYITSKATSDPTKIIDGFGLSYQAMNIKCWVKDIQIELGSTATDYEPYSGQTYDITLPTEAGTVYGGELTVNADGSGSLVVDKGIYIPQSTDGMQIYNYQENHGVLFINCLPNNLERANGLCSHSGKVGLYLDSNSVWLGVNSQNIYWIGIFDILGISTLEEFKNWLDTQTVQFVYPLTTPITYTLTASQIRTLLGQNNIWADTGDLALTYTGTDEHLTLESGKKYLARISGTDSMLLGSGQEITAAKGTDNVFDLTQMFGTAVADYVYGQGAAFFRKWFPGARYPYNAGELLSVEGLQSHDMVGFNAWDEEWEVGAYSSADGNKVVLRDRIRSKNEIQVLPDTMYAGNIGLQLYYYDADHKFLTWTTISNGKFRTPTDAKYMTFNERANSGTTYHHNICFNLSHNASRNGEYAPYEKHSYPLDSSVILRGVPKVGANGVYWDGDRYLPDGTVSRNWMEYTFTGNENISDWLSGVYGNRVGLTLPTWALKPEETQRLEMVAVGYVPASLLNSNTMQPGQCMLYPVPTNRVSVFFCVPKSCDTQESARSYVSGTKVLVRVSTPTTETAQPYHSTQWVSDWGTEEFVSTGLVPVGHETRYPANLRDKLQHLPDAASGNGSYLITQTDGQMVLTPFPAPPSTAGNYVLKATVTNGVATYTWEVAT